MIETSLKLSSALPSLLVAFLNKNLYKIQEKQNFFSIYFVLPGKTKVQNLSFIDKQSKFITDQNSLFNDNKIKVLQNP